MKEIKYQGQITLNNIGTLTNEYNDSILEKNIFSDFMRPQKIGRVFLPLTTSGAQKLKQLLITEKRDRYV